MVPLRYAWHCQGNSKKILLNCFVCYLVCKCVAVVQMGASDSDTWPREENQIERDFSFDPEILNNLCVTHMRRNFTPFPPPPFSGENSCLPEGILAISAVNPWHFGTDADLHHWLMNPDSDPVFYCQWLRSSQQKISIFSKFFCLLLLEGTFTSVFKN
jgi:hypothetical protein